MNTKAFEQFEMLDNTSLANINGGDNITKGAYKLGKATRQATTDVIANGWVSSLAGGYFGKP